MLGDFSLFRVVVKEEVADCAVATDYRPYIAQAERDAIGIWTAMTCAPGCRKGPGVEDYVEWKCDVDLNGRRLIRVFYYFHVDCAQ